MHTCRAISEHVARVRRYEDAVVEAMFTGGRTYFMEWDSERAGGFRGAAPAPRAKTVARDKA